MLESDTIFSIMFTIESVLRYDRLKTKLTVLPNSMFIRVVLHYSKSFWDATLMFMLY